MKKIFLLVFTSVFSVATYAADFTISVSAPPAKGLNIYRKSDNQKMGKFTSLYGVNSILTTSNQIQLDQVFNVVFSGPNCTGDSYIQISPLSIIDAIISNNGSFYKITGYSTLQNIQSRRSNNSACAELIAQLNVAPAELVVDTSGLIDLSSGNLGTTSLYYYKAE